MASISQLNPYQCDQCGTANIVAAPSSTNREHAPILAPLVRGRANPTLLKWLHRPALVDTGDLYPFGDP